MMKLYDLLKMTDTLTTVVVWEKGCSEEEGPSYEGSACDVPYTLADMYLYKGLEDGTCAISVRVRDSESGCPIMVVSVKEEKEV